MQLNLARKWRSQSFEQVVGQELAVRILKNSLFLGKFFPVYLLAGQHGCGKTTTARVFAAAVNCALLPDFQQDPQKIPVPCGACPSCCAMRAGKHPDFIEIDAASHTGVDNVRQLIETATLMPLMGRKRIYLIDEAHMLSKSAFNAFLKMLEEPSDFVLFMLATTDEHKIIETVKSRCFQLFFQAVTPQTLCAHLERVCQQENIICEPDGLALIVRQSQGSVRDALNLTEQVFLSEQRVGKIEVLRVIGAASDEIVLELFKQLVQAGSAQDFVQKIEQLDLERYNAEYVWRQLLEVLQVTFWEKCGCEQTKTRLNVKELSESTQEVSLEQLMNLFSWWCQEEAVFLKTVNKTIFLQIFLVRAWMNLHVSGGADQISGLPRMASRAAQTPDFVLRTPTDRSQNRLTKPGQAEAPSNHPEPCPERSRRVVEGCFPSLVATSHEIPAAWSAFVQELEVIQEPMLVSIFKQARVIAHDDKQVQVHLAQRFIFLKDTIEQTKDRWMALFAKHFGIDAQLCYSFVEQMGEVSGIAENVKKKPVELTTQVSPTRVSMVRDQKYGVVHAIDVSDKDRWPLTHTLLEYFPGRVTQVIEPVTPVKKQVVYDDNSQE